MEGYRKDIEGLRAIAVLCVILFHFGLLPEGYLGVDVFFVISGYLITNIIYGETVENRFSITAFYLRRIRRIVPLILFASIISLIVGLCGMLPDDLENLSQSIVATNLFCNNILQFLTTRNYWDIANEFKPLMHTWSLGVEEQFYLFYPFLFLIFKGKRIQWALPVLLTLTAISLLLFFSSIFTPPEKYYLIPFRFFELSLGGVGAILFKNRLNHKYAPFLIAALILSISVPFKSLPGNSQQFITVIVTLALLVSARASNKITSYILEHKILVGIGKISFSLYVWHQIVLAFIRYFLMHEIKNSYLPVVFLIILVISILSYFLIEQPFRNKAIINTRPLLWGLGITSVLTISIGYAIYLHAGVVTDVPELDIRREEVSKNMHSRYNSDIYKMDRQFSGNNKIKVLVVGNSFARDWVNILLSSKYNNDIEISYSFRLSRNQESLDKIQKANYIFFSEADTSTCYSNLRIFGIDSARVWCIGTKNFGDNNGIYYQRKGSPDYCIQRTKIIYSYIRRNDRLKNEWAGKYIDLIGLMADNNGTVPVFTPDCKFISQDCRHLTRAGAEYFARLLEQNHVLAFDSLKSR